VAVGVLELTVNVSLEVADPLEGVTDDGDKVQVTPVLGHEAVKFTAELKPFNHVMVIVEVLLLPFLMLSELGDADKEKSPGAAPCVVAFAVLE
jgi:hypothetical protein